MKKYLIITLFALLGAFLFVSNLYLQERKEKQRISNNLVTSLSQIETYKTKEGELVSVIKGYEFKVKEFKQLVPELYKEIKTLNIKLKNAQSVTKIITKIEYKNKDSIIPVLLNDTTKLYKIESEWVNADFKITNNNCIKPSDFNISSIPNTTIIVPEITFKGWWFWRKATGIDLHIKHSNPYITTSQGAYINLK